MPVLTNYRDFLKIMPNLFSTFAAVGAGLSGFTATNLVRSFGEAATPTGIIMNVLGVALAAGVTAFCYKTAPKP